MAKLILILFSFHVQAAFAFLDFTGVYTSVILGQKTQVAHVFYENGVPLISFNKGCTGELKKSGEALIATCFLGQGRDRSRFDARLVKENSNYLLYYQFLSSSGGNEASEGIRLALKQK